jgi:hexosaminidase
MKHTIQKIIPVVLSLLICAAAGAQNSTPVIPAPVKVESRDGVFLLQSNSRIIADAGLKDTAKLLAARLRPATGFRLKITSGKTKMAAGDIVLMTNDAVASLGAEGYELSVTTNGVAIRAPSSAGIFYGAQSLLQLLPPEIFSSKPVKEMAWTIPCVEISDSPRFVWRGFMLDVSRHFFTETEVEKVLDLMALYKLNTFHWHLTDDQGWRIQIKKYPKLTSVGAWRKAIGFGLASNSATAYDKQGRYGGFYTQKQIREVVAYAAARHITIVPEIEMPGHSIAALAAYPQFSCTGGPFTTDRDGGVYDGIYNVSDEATYVFLGNILKEVSGLFPARFIHIGGDEVPKKVWHNSPSCQALMKREGLKNERELQSYFTARIEKLVNADGKRIIGWSEIREGGLTPSAALMDWIGGGAESASSGHDVVMTPTKYCYFDHYQSTNQMAEPKAIGGFLPLERVYQFEPLPQNLAPEFRAQVLGGQANLWTEYVPNLRQVEYMMFPRLDALSEVDWSPKSAHDWENFKARAGFNEKRLDELGVNYRPISQTGINERVH